MNTYQLDLNAGGKGIRNTDFDIIARIVSIIVFYGKNITLTAYNNAGKNPYTLQEYAPRITFDLDFGLSNISILDKAVPVGVSTDTQESFLLRTINYDTRHQNVKEWIDVPVVEVGFWVVAIPVDDSPNIVNIQKDFSDYNRLPILCQNNVQNATLRKYIYYGKSAFRLTNFYTPFDKMSKAIINPLKIKK